VSQTHSRTFTLIMFHYDVYPIYVVLHAALYTPLEYRVIRKSVKHFKNSRQINYSTDRGSSYADRERNSPSFFKHISQMLNVSTFGNTTDIYATVHLVPHACQHIAVDQSHSNGDTAAKIWRLAGNGSTKTVSFTNPPEEKFARG